MANYRVAMNEKMKKIAYSMKSKTLSAYKENQSGKIPFFIHNEDKNLTSKGVLHMEQCTIQPVDRYRYLDKWHMYKYSTDEPEKTIGILKVENLPMKPLRSLNDKESFIASIDSILINRYCENFLLFIDNKFVDWNNMDLVYDAGRTYLILHGEQYNIYNLRKAKSFKIMVLPFNIDYIAEEDSDTFDNNFRALENYLNDDTTKDGYSRINVPTKDTIHFYNGHSYSLGAWIFKQHKYRKLGMLSKDREDRLSNISIMKYKYDGSGKVIDSKITRFNALDEDSINQTVFSSYCVYKDNEEYNSKKLFSFNKDGLLDSNGDRSIYITPANRIQFTKYESSNRVVYSENDNIDNILTRDNYIVFRNGLIDTKINDSEDMVLGSGNLMRINNTDHDKLAVYTFYHLDSNKVLTTPYRFNMDYFKAKAKYLFNVENANSLALLQNPNGTESIYGPMNDIDIDEDYYTEEIISTGIYKINIDLEGNVSGGIISLDDIEDKNNIYGIVLIDTNSVSHTLGLNIDNIENYIGNNINGLYENFNGYIFRAGMDGDVSAYSVDDKVLFRIESKHILSEDGEDLHGRLFILDNEAFTLPIEILSSLFALCMNDDGSFNGKRIDLLDIKGLNDKIHMSSKHTAIAKYVKMCEDVLDFKINKDISTEDNISNAYDVVKKFDKSILYDFDIDINCFSIDPIEANESLEYNFREYNIRGLKIPRGGWRNHETYCLIFLNGELISNYSDLLAYHDYFILPMEYDFKPTDEIEVMQFFNCNNNELEFKMTSDILNNKFHAEEITDDFNDPDEVLSYDADGRPIDTKEGMARHHIRVRSDIFHEFIDPIDLKIFAKYPKDMLIYKDLIEESDTLAFNISFRHPESDIDDKISIYPQSISPSNRGTTFYAVAGNKFVYQRLYTDGRTYRFKLDKRFRFCNNAEQYMVFINGRRLYDESFLITIPNHRAPFWGTYLYLAKFVNATDRVEVFYVPKRMSINNENIVYDESGYLNSENELTLPLDPKYYVFFVNGKKIPSDSIIPIGRKIARISKDIKTISPVVFTDTLSHKSNYYNSFSGINEEETLYYKIIDFICANDLLGKRELDNLFNTWVTISNSEDNMLTQSVGRIAILNEVVRDFWVTSGFEYNKDPWFPYNYHLMTEYMGTPNSYEDRVMLPALDANQNINIRKEDARLLYFIAESSNTGFFERGSVVDKIKFLWEYANSIYKDDHNITVVAQDLNGDSIPVSAREYEYTKPISNDTKFTFTGNVGYKLLQAIYNIRFVDPIYYGAIDEDTFEHYRKNSLLSISDLIALVPRNGRMPSSRELEKYQSLRYTEKNLRKRFRIFRDLIYRFGDAIVDMHLNHMMIDDIVAIIPKDSNDLMNMIMEDIAEEGLRPVLDRFKHFWLRDCMIMDADHKAIHFIDDLKAFIYDNTRDLMTNIGRINPGSGTVLFDDNVDKIYASVFIRDGKIVDNRINPDYLFIETNKNNGFTHISNASIITLDGKTYEFDMNKLTEIFGNAVNTGITTSERDYNTIINGNPEIRISGPESYEEAIERLNNGGVSGIVMSSNLNKPHIRPTMPNPSLSVNMKPFLLIYDENNKPILGKDFVTIYEAPDEFMERYYNEHPAYKKYKYKKTIDAYTGMIIYVLEDGRIIKPSNNAFSGGTHTIPSGGTSNSPQIIQSDLPTVKLDELRARFNIMGGSKHGNIIYGNESQIYIANQMMVVLLNPDNSMVNMTIEHRAFVNATPNELDRARVMRIDNDPNLYALVEGAARRKIYSDFKITDVNTKDLIFSNKELKTVMAHIEKHLQDTPDIDIKYPLGNHNYFIYAIPKYMGFKDDNSMMRFDLQNLKDKEILKNTYRDFSAPLYTSGDIGDNGSLEPLSEMVMDYMGETDFTSEYGITIRYCIWRTNGFFAKLNPKFGVKIKAYKSA